MFWYMSTYYFISRNSVLMSTYTLLAASIEFLLFFFLNVQIFLKLKILLQRKNVHPYIYLLHCYVIIRCETGVEKLLLPIKTCSYEIVLKTLIQNQYTNEFALVRKF